MGDKYDYAKMYVEVFGYSVIPVTANSKKPAIEWKEYQQRKPTEEELKKWFLENDYNIGIVTGAISGIAVVDLDSKEAIEFSKKNNFPKTPYVKTGKGYHLYFKYQNGVRNFQKRPDLKDIDLRADGGYVIAPPSIHPKTKKPYEWKIIPGEIDYAELPEIILQKPQQKSQLAELYKGVSEGERNNTLTRLVGSWVSDGLSFEECLENALLWNSKNDPPLPEKEVETTVKSIFEKHRKIDILPPIFEITEIPFGYEMFNPQFKLYFKVKNICQDKEGLKCYLEVTCEDNRAMAKDIYSANFNFYSSRGTQELAKVLSANLPFLANPTQLIESFKKEFKKCYSISKIKKVTSNDITNYDAEFLLQPFVLKNNINLIYGLGATGKSTFACYLASLLDKRGYRVLYLDYENPTSVEIERIILKISPDINNIYILCPKTRLVNTIEKLYEDVKKYKIDVIIVDSVIKSMVADVFNPEAISLYTTSLLKIPVTWLLISHVAKNTSDESPYGSVFFFNDARNVWFAKRIANHENNIIQLIHKKSNFTKLFPSEIFEFRYEIGKIKVIQKSIEDYGTITDMILATLSEEPKTFSQLHKALPSINTKKLSVYLNRLKKKGQIKIDNGLWTIIENEDD